MAITDATPTAIVQVVANGAPLREYIDTDITDTDKHVTRYVEAVSDQVFEVHCFLSTNTHFQGDRISFRIFVDGHKVDSSFFRPTKVGYTKKCRGWEDGPDKLRRFCFSNLSIDAESNTKKDDPKLRELGNIRVELHHRRSRGQSRIKAGPQLDEAPTIGPVSEKALKGQAVSHSVGFTDPVHSFNTSRRSRADYVSPTRSPFAVYEFRYRSMEALKSMLIIPRTPSPEPEQTDRPPLAGKDVNEMTIEELRDLVRQSQQTQHNTKTKARIKQESEGPQRRKTKGEVITIELDDDGEVVSETRVKAEVTPDESVLIDG